MPFDEKTTEFIRRAKAAGYTTDEIAAYLQRPGQTAGTITTPENMLSGTIPPPPAPPPVTPEQQAEGREFFTETLPRAGVALGTGLALAPLTGGMSLPAAMATEAGVVGGADLAYQGVRKVMDPSRTVNPRESFDIGAASGGGSGLVRGGLKLAQGLAGRIARIPHGAIDEVTERAPYGGRKAIGLIRSAPPEAEHELAKAAQASVTTQRAPSLPTAEAAVAAHAEPVDVTPIFDRIMSRYRASPVNAAEESANKALEDLADRLPQSMTMTELEDYLRRIRIPVSDRMGKTGGSLAAQDVKDVQAFVRQYRDNLLTKAGQQEGVEAFARSSEEVDAIKKFRKLILDDKGDLRRSAENTIRRLPSNRVIMGVFERYDKATGTNLTQRARDLALKRQWTPTDQGDAGALTEILTRLERGTGLISSIIRPVASGAAKTITVGLPPLGLPRMISGAGAGGYVALDKEEKRIRARRNP